MGESGDEIGPAVDEIGSIVVVDAGSSQWRAGFVTDEGPSFVEVAPERVTAEWWRQLFRRLETEPQETSVLLSEAPDTTEAERATSIAMLLRDVGVYSLYVSTPQLLALYGSEATTGLVVDVGERRTTIWPVFEGRPVLRAATSVELGGHHLTAWLARRLRSEGHRVTDAEAARLKEAHAAVAPDRARRKRAPPTVVDAADGGSLSIPSAELQRCGEILFDPSPVTDM